MRCKFGAERKGAMSALFTEAVRSDRAAVLSREEEEMKLRAAVWWVSSARSDQVLFSRVA